MRSHITTIAGTGQSFGSVDDSYGNAMAEPIIELLKTDGMRPGGPWRSLESVEHATPEWVDWFNKWRLLGPIVGTPPVELEQAHYDDLEAPAVAARLTPLLTSSSSEP